jgi:hypothetical protein
MPSPFRPVPAGLIPIAEAAERLQVSEGKARAYFGQAKRRPAWLNRWIAAHGKSLSWPTMVMRILSDGKRGRRAYVKLSDVELIERAKADSRRDEPPKQIVHRGEVCLSVPEFARRSGIKEATLYFRIRRGMMKAVRKRPANPRRVRGNEATIYLPASLLAGCPPKVRRKSCRQA